MIYGLSLSPFSYNYLSCEGPDSFDLSFLVCYHRDVGGCMLVVQFPSLLLLYFLEIGVEFPSRIITQIQGLTLGATLILLFHWDSSSH